MIKLMMSIDVMTGEISVLMKSFLPFYCAQRLWAAAEICSLLWKISSPFNPCFDSVSISLGLDYNWYHVVLQCQELRMFCSNSIPSAVF